MADRDDDELFRWDPLPARSEDEETPPPPPPDQGFSALDFVRSMFQQPLLGEIAPPPPPTLRSAANELFRSSGLFGEAPASMTTAPAVASSSIPASGEFRPPSWKHPSRGMPPTILGDDTAAGPGRGADSTAPAPEGDLPASSATPGETPALPALPLDHPDAQSGLALTAADTLLRQGIGLAVNLAAGNPALARKLIELGANAFAGVVPPEYRASAKTSVDAAAAEAERRIADNDRATRTRAAIGTLANRRSEADHDHAAAVVAGDRAKIEEARREAIDAWRAERRARGDGEAEINAGAHALERDYRKTALRHRLAQLDGAGIERAFDEDEEAKADLALAREVASNIQRLRRDDPARVAEASIERKLAEKKRDGRIDTPEEEARERYKLRLEAQAQRGIPEHQRRLLTNQERTALATEYLRIESSQGKAAADAWLDAESANAGPAAERFKVELTTPQFRSAVAHERSTQRHQIAELPGTAEDSPTPSDADDGRVEPAQEKNDSVAPPTPGSVRRPPTTEAEREEREEVVRKEGLERFKDLSREQWKERFEILLEIAKREGFLPRPFARHLWGQFRDRHASIDERLDAARAIAELQNLFPREAERFFGNGELVWIGEIVRLDDEGKLPPEQIIDRAANNVSYIDLRRPFEWGVLAGAAASMAARRRRGLKAEGTFAYDYRVTPNVIHQHPIGYPKSFAAEIPWIAGEDGSLTLRYDEDADRFFPATWDEVFSLGFERDEIEQALKEATDARWRFTVDPSFPVFAQARAT